ncbi:Fe-Mn family superoxide dismutase [Exophiala viscosa]|uniref:Superoxide dismutase n=1 Tax=Exophiala viscosa TaxID=2486360 RepID=A0AAN6E6I0_9EURO|nr:Fe-Mn family superoxide dismutase [Exophiala viscosa]
MAVEQYSPPGLRYSLDALEPSISGQIMDLHYNKHHQTYITNLNKALKETAEALSNGNLVKQLELQSAIKFNAGGHVNHTLFWENLSPRSTGDSDTASAAPKLHQDITTALAIQGSGWVWLVKNELGGRLEITTSKDQDLPVPGNLAVLGIDMWEHAYYLQYWNNKKEYLNNIWAVLNWNAAGKRYLGDRRAIYGDLAGLASRL